MENHLNVFGVYKKMIGECGVVVEPNLVGIPVQELSSIRVFYDSANSCGGNHTNAIDCMQCSFVYHCFWYPESLKTNLISWADPFGSRESSGNASDITRENLENYQIRDTRCTFCSKRLPGNIHPTDMPLVYKLFKSEVDRFVVSDEMVEDGGQIGKDMSDSMLDILCTSMIKMPSYTPRPFIMVNNSLLEQLGQALDGHGPGGAQDDPRYVNWQCFTKQSSHVVVPYLRLGGDPADQRWDTSTSYDYMRKFFNIDFEYLETDGWELEGSYSWRLTHTLKN